MKLTNLLFAMTLLLLFPVIYSNGQGVYVNAGAGYGFSTASQLLGDNYSYSYSADYDKGTWSNNYHDTAVTGSLGKGINFGGAAGYMFSKHIGIEAGVSFLSGSEYTFNSHESENFTSSSDTRTYFATASRKESASMLRIIPALKIQAGGNKIQPYLKTGLVIGLAGSYKSTVNSREIETYSGPFINSSSDTTYITERKYSGRTSLGFMAAAGADFKFGKIFSVYGELNMISQSWAPAHGEVTSYTVNGVNELSSLNVSQKQADFSDNYASEYSSASKPNDSAPAKELKSYLPFCSWGISLGIHLTFGGSSSKSEVQPK